jgi:hypothetical protein
MRFSLTPEGTAIAFTDVGTGIHTVNWNYGLGEFYISENRVGGVLQLPVRATDMNSVGEVVGSSVLVQEGTQFAGVSFVQHGVVTLIDDDHINFSHLNLAPYLKHDGTVLMTGSLDFGGNNIINVNEISNHITEIVTQESATEIISLFDNHTSNIINPVYRLYQVNDRIIFTNATGSLPFLENFSYYVIENSAGFIKLSISLGGPEEDYYEVFDTGTYVDIERYQATVGHVNITSNVSLQTNKITNLANPTSNQDAATKSYSDHSIQPTPSAADTTSTLVYTDMLNRIVTSAPAENISLTLQVNTNLALYTLLSVANNSFEWVIINTSAFVITLAENTGHTIVGSLSIPADSSASLRTRFVSTGVYVTYRI